MRIGLLAAGAVAAVLAGGAGYAALNQPAERRAVVLPAAPVPVVPLGEDLLPTVLAVPSAAPIVKSPARPGPSAKPSRTFPAESERRAVAAWYSGGGQWRSDGLHRYGGTLSLSEPADKPWRIRLTVPGGNRVHAGGDVRVRQSGERVVFTPGPRGVVTFDFRIDGVLPAEPHDCLVNGHTCG
jgi:hypothetical protein